MSSERRSLPWLLAALLITPVAACGPDLGHLVDSAAGPPPPSPDAAVAGSEASRPSSMGADAAQGTPDTARNLPPDPAPALLPDAAAGLPTDAAPDPPSDAAFSDASADAAGCAGPRPSCASLHAACGAPPDGCGGVLACGDCADPLTSCAATFSCACGRPTALFSPDGVLEPAKRAVAPDGAWYATAAGVFATVSGRPVWPLPQVKAFDWHPTVSGRFAQMEHFQPPRPPALVTVYQLSPDGSTATIIARASSDMFHHALAWVGPDSIALGAVGGCTTVKIVVPAPPP